MRESRPGPRKGYRCGTDAFIQISQRRRGNAAATPAHYFSPPSQGAKGESLASLAFKLSRLYTLCLGFCRMQRASTLPIEHGQRQHGLSRREVTGGPSSTNP